MSRRAPLQAPRGPRSLPPPAPEPTYRGRSRSRRREYRDYAPSARGGDARGRRGAETIDPVEEKLQELEANGCLPPGTLDDQALELLAQVESRVALHALSEWEARSIASGLPRNPSASLVALTKRIKNGDGGRDSGRDSGRYNGRERPSERDERRPSDRDERDRGLEETASMLRLDRRDLEQLREVPSHEATAILQDLVAETVNTPSVNRSTFVARAVRRYQEEKRPGRGRGDERSRGYGDERSSGYGAERGATRSHDYGESWGIDRGHRHDDWASSSTKYDSREQREGGYSGAERGGHRWDAPTKDSATTHRDDWRGDRGGSPIDKLLDEFDTVLDGGAKDAVQKLDIRDAREILDGLRQSGSGVRNPSAFVFRAASTKMKQQRDKPPRTAKDDFEDSIYNHSGLDEGAVACLRELSPERAIKIIEVSDVKGDSLRNPSAWVQKASQGEAQRQKDKGDKWGSNEDSWYSSGSKRDW